MKYTKLEETNNWVVEYNESTKEFRISYFEDGHYKDEIIFQYKK